MTVKHALQAVPQTDDQRLESMIAEAKDRMVDAANRGDMGWRNRWAAVMTSLLGQRSPEQVARMERRLGV